MKIVVDAAGGDHYPKNPIAGSLQAIEAIDDIEILLVGPEKLIRNELEDQTAENHPLEVVDAPQVIAMDESPTHAVKTKQQSSINVGLQLLANQQADAFISAGNTGALMAASVLILGRLKGIHRPTIASYFPTIKGNRLLIDAGASLDVKPDTMVQFAKMGTIYLQEIMGVKNVKVGLLNVGEEPEKGRDIHKQYHQKLTEMDHFIGNIEGKDILEGKTDLFLCDGFVGNILLKFGESFPPALQFLLRNSMKQLQLSDQEKQLIGKVFKHALREFDHEAVGGLPFLGVKGISMVGHGSSSPRAIKNMISNAVDCVRTDINSKIVSSLN